MKLLEQALKYQKLGWAILPMIPGIKEKKPYVKWKQYQTKPPSEKQLREWWKEFPEANIGLITGETSKVMVLDADSQKAHDFIDQQGGMPPTPQSSTGKDSGNHFFFQYPDFFVKNDVNKELGLDIRGNNGLIVLPPSIHHTGRKYQWAQYLSPWDADLEELRPWMVEYIHKRNGNESQTSLKNNWQEEALQGVPDGSRNATAAQLAGRYIRKGLSTGETTAILLTWNKENKPPLDESEIVTTVASVQATHNRNENAPQPEVAEELPPYIQELNKTHAVVTLGGKTVVLNEVTNPVFERPDITFSTIQDFTNWYKNQKVLMSDPDPDKPAKSIAVSKLWLESPDRRQYKGIVFDPLGTPEGFYNLWRGFAVEPHPGDWSLYQEHMWENICGEKELLFDYVKAWMADTVQNPGGERPGVSVVLRGAPGVGKGVWSTGFGKLFGAHFLHITNQNQLTGRFNNHLKDALVTFCDEAIWAGDKGGEGVLKGMITEEHHMIEPKGKDAFAVKNRVRLIVASNSEWVVPAGLGDRRFLVLDVGDGRRRDHQYFGKLIDQMNDGGRAAMLHDLLHHDISTTNLRVYPSTEALLEQKLRTMTPVQKFWFDTLANGTITASSEHWVKEISSELLYEDYKDFTSELGIRHLLTSNIFFKELKRLMPTGFLKVRKRADKGGRKYVYAIPDLDDCRKYFEKILGTNLDWDALVAN